MQQAMLALCALLALTARASAPESAVKKIPPRPPPPPSPPFVASPPSPFPPPADEFKAAVQERRAWEAAHANALPWELAQLDDVWECVLFGWERAHQPAALSPYCETLLPAPSEGSC